MASNDSNLQEVQLTERLKLQEGTKKSGNTTEVSETVKKDVNTESAIKEAVKELKEPVDQYISEENEEKESYGRYEPVSDKKGGFKIEFSVPETDKQKDASEAQVIEGEEGSGEQKLEKTGHTDVLKLKMKQKELKQQIKSEADPQKVKDLKRKLAQVEQKLKSKGK